MTVISSHCSDVSSPPRIIALQKRRKNEACLIPGQPKTKPRRQFWRAFDRQQAEQSLRQLQALCILSPELERITRNTHGHWQNGTHTRDGLIDVLHRFLVEPAAIDLTALHLEAHRPWFEADPAELRRLAPRLALVMGQDIGDVNNARAQIDEVDT